ncbi:10763_t:CDS:2, partial [Ambispora leptoticha]
DSQSVSVTIRSGDRDAALLSNNGQSSDSSIQPPLQSSLESLAIPSSLVIPSLTIPSQLTPIISSLLSSPFSLPSSILLSLDPSTSAPSPSLSSQSPILTSDLITSSSLPSSVTSILASTTTAASSSPISTSTIVPTSTASSSSIIKPTDFHKTPPFDNGPLPTSEVTSTTNFTNESNNSDGKNKLNTGIILGIIFAILIILLILAYFGYRAIRRRKKGKGVMRLPQDLETTYLPSMTHAIPAHQERHLDLELPTQPFSFLSLYKNPSTSSFIEDFNDIASGSGANGTFNRDDAVGSTSGGNGINNNNSSRFLYGETVVGNTTSSINMFGAGLGLRRSSSAPSSPSSPTGEKVVEMELIAPASEQILVTRDRTVQVEHVPSSDITNANPPSPRIQTEQQSPLENPFMEHANPFEGGSPEEDSWEEFEDTSEDHEVMAFSIEDVFPKPPERHHDAVSFFTCGQPNEITSLNETVRPMQSQKQTPETNK